MKVVIDTHVLFWILTQDLSKVSDIALKALEQAEEIILPTIVLLELLSLLQKKRSIKYFDELLKQIPKSKYIATPMDMSVVQQVRKIKSKLELHDKVIVATAKYLSVPIVTKDKEITEKYTEVIW